MSEWQDELSDNELLSRQFDLLQMSVIQQLRIYDILMVLLRNSNEEAANKLLDMHEKFEHIGPLPYDEEYNAETPQG